jgi:hypothetical protein
MRTSRPILALTILSLASLAFAADDDNPIKKAMQFAHKAPQGQKKVSEKIIEGTATDDEVQKTLALYKAIGDTKPPKGDPAAFKEKVAKVIVAAEDVAAKKPGAADEFKSAVNCKSCHSDFRADKK